MATGDRKERTPRIKEDVPPPGNSGGGHRVRSTDIHTDAWAGVNQDPRTYLTTQQLAEDLGNWSSSLDDGRRMFYPESMYRWCKQWFGELPPGRTGPKMGYRIPPEYRYVARVWALTENHDIRKVAKKALLEDAKEGIGPKPWIVVVANLGSTHYTVPEVSNRVFSLLPLARQRNRMVHALFVGSERNPEDG